MSVHSSANHETLRELSERKSVRAFLPEPIRPEDRLAILEAAVQAPSAGNQQLYTILEITDPGLKAQLSESCDHQPFIASAPMVLIFLADVRRWLDIYDAAGVQHRDPGPGDLLLAVSDANIAAQNAVCAAWSLGVGSCYIGDIMEACETHREMLHLPCGVFPAAMLVFGYPTQQQKERVKPRRAPLSSIVQENAYHIREADELRAMTEKDWHVSSFEDWVQRFCQRKYNSSFAREMSRSVAEYLKDYQ